MPYYMVELLSLKFERFQIFRVSARGPYVTPARVPLLVSRFVLVIEHCLEAGPWLDGHLSIILQLFPATIRPSPSVQNATFSLFRRSGRAVSWRV